MPRMKSQTNHYNVSACYRKDTFGGALCVRLQLKLCCCSLFGFGFHHGPFGGKDNTKKKEEELAKAVTSGLVVALAIGLLQFACFTLLAQPIVTASGISPSTNPCSDTMYATAVSYTRARATSAPSSTLWLVTTGIFRGTFSFSISQV
jgi:Na+-driven multidrug efflux pump